MRRSGTYLKGVLFFLLLIPISTLNTIDLPSPDLEGQQAENISIPIESFDILNDIQDSKVNTIDEIGIPGEATPVVVPEGPSADWSKTYGGLNKGCRPSDYIVEG